MSQKTIKNTYLVDMPSINSDFFKTLSKRIPYNYLPINCIEPIYNYMCDSISMILSALRDDYRPYIIMQGGAKMIVKKQEKTPKPELELELHEFPDPGISEMVCLYPELQEIMGTDLARTVIEYNDKKTNKPLLYLFPSNTLQPPTGCRAKLSKALELIDDDACSDLCMETQKRREYMKIYYKNHDM